MNTLQSDHIPDNFSYIGLAKNHLDIQRCEKTCRTHVVPNHAFSQRHHSWYRWDWKLGCFLLKKPLKWKQNPQKKILRTWSLSCADRWAAVRKSSPGHRCLLDHHLAGLVVVRKLRQLVLSYQLQLCEKLRTAHSQWGSTFSQDYGQSQGGAGIEEIIDNSPLSWWISISYLTLVLCLFPQWRWY